MTRRFLLVSQNNCRKSAKPLWPESYVRISTTSSPCRRRCSWRRTSFCNRSLSHFPRLATTDESVFPFSNSPIPCDLLTDIDLGAWASDSPALQVPDELLKESIQRAMVDMALRREQEYQLFKKSKRPLDHPRESCSLLLTRLEDRSEVAAGHPLGFQSRQSERSHHFQYFSALGVRF